MSTQELEVVSPADRQKQEQLLDRVDALLDETRLGQEKLHRNFIEIGLALDAVENSKAWMLRAKSYDSYIRERCEPRFGKSRTQLYGYRSVAKNLLPYLSAEKLMEIGISKAQPLATFVKNSGKKPPDTLLEAAKNTRVGVEEFRATIAEITHDGAEKGKWLDMGGFYCTADEKIEIEMGLERAETIEPLPADAPVWLARKVAIQRLVAEFLATYPCTENE